LVAFEVLTVLTSAPPSISLQLTLLYADPLTIWLVRANRFLRSETILCACIQINIK